jgi:hypothetical protein
MISLKRMMFRIGIPAATLVLGVTLYAQSRSNDCGHPSVVAKVMQATGFAHIQPCAVDSFDGTEICHDNGHHCNIGNGPGKCQTIVDPVTGEGSCQCVLH